MLFISILHIKTRFKHFKLTAAPLFHKKDIKQGKIIQRKKYL